MKLFAAGIETETNTFSPMPTGLGHFDITRHSDVARDPKRLTDLVPFNLWLKASERKGVEFYFGLYAVAEPSGITTKTAYETLRDELLRELKSQLPVDGVLLCLHGAMVATDYQDCEGDLISRIRELVGPGVAIGVELDLHCHLTPQMTEHADLIITLKEYPHIDVEARGEELFTHLYNTMTGQCLPTKSVFNCHMAGLYPTTAKPLSDFVATMQSVELEAGVLSVSFIHGFPFGDVAEAGGKLLVITDSNQPQADQLSTKLGLEIFSHRKHIGFNALSLADALNKALALSQPPEGTGSRPIVVADQSDNPGGGAPADATYALAWLLQNQVRNVALAIFYDPEVVKLACAAGVGATLPVRFGGKMGQWSGEPLDLTVTVTAINDNYYHQFPQSQGEPNLFATGATVALHCQGIDLIVSSERTQCFSPSIFDDFDIPARERDVLVVKSSQHFYSAFKAISPEIIYMAAPGALSSKITALTYQSMPTQDKYPWVDNPFEKEGTHDAIG